MSGKDVYCHDCGAKLSREDKVFYNKILMKSTRLPDGRCESEFLYDLLLCKPCAEAEKEGVNYE